MSPTGLNTDSTLYMTENSSFDDLSTQHTNAPSIKTIEYSLSWDDATWILTSSFIIFTMQSGWLVIRGNA